MLRKRALHGAMQFSFLVFLSLLNEAMTFVFVSMPFVLLLLFIFFFFFVGFEMKKKSGGGEEEQPREDAGKGGVEESETLED